MRVLVLSTYELGHQPLLAASATAALRSAGHEVRAVDLAVDPWDDDAVAWADGVAFAVPMHTAMRLAAAAARRIRDRRPDLPVCFFGLYAGMGDALGRQVAGEYEDGLLAWAADPGAGGHSIDLTRRPARVPARDLLPPLDRYARMEVAGERRLVGYVEASRGCAHRCRHCPVPVVYDGRVRTVDVEVVLADIAQQVAMGARHITFGDPDFLNAPAHARRMVDAMHGAFPELTFDCTVKVEHILRHPDVWPAWAGAGCLFVVSAVESVNDDILVRLDKGHTAAGAAAAVATVRAQGIDLRPSFLPFTPWTTIDDVVDLLHFVADLDLVGSVDPVQYTIRLLLPRQSLLLDRDDVRSVIGLYDPDRLTYTWSSPDPAVDALQAELAELVESGAAAGAGTVATFLDVGAAVHRAAGVPFAGAAALSALAAGSTEGRPRLTEPWFC